MGASAFGSSAAGLAGSSAGVAGSSAGAAVSSAGIAGSSAGVSAGAGSGVGAGLSPHPTANNVSPSNVIPKSFQFAPSLQALLTYGATCKQISLVLLDFRTQRQNVIY